MPLPFSPLDKNSQVPLHKQLYEQFRDAILARSLRSETRLPSTRELAKHLGISRNTVVTTFEQLLAEGFLTGRIGAGTFVSSDFSEDSAPASSAASRQETRALPNSSRISEALTRSKRELYLDSLGAFRPSVPALDLFPWPTWQRLVSTCARSQTRSHLAYSGPLGLEKFRDEIASYLRTARNVRCDADQVIVVSGSQQALCIAAQVLLEKDDEVWLEEPGYTGARDAFLLMGLQIGAVPVDDEGLDVDAGQRLFPDARLAYITPSHQYPLGVTMSIQRRMKLLEWAVARNSWVVEDDFDSEYRYTSRPISSLQGLTDQNRVIYIGTFSKVLFPSLRIGYLVVPRHLIEHFTAIRRAYDIYPPPLLQLVLTEFMAQGHFARHIYRMRAVYSERRDELIACLEREMGDLVSVGVADSGTYLVVYPKSQMDDVELCIAAAHLGIVATPLSSCYYSQQPQSGIILGFGGTDASQIRRGVTTLRKAFLELA